ncbi:MAG TPA: hypothetical protein VFR94_14270 [Nitrososphaeraceae archaeon]|nr:hypothetical protein [Nitrososphaeraceae archaeon]
MFLSATLIGSILFYNGNNFIILDAQGQNPQYQSQNAPMQEAPPLLQSAVAVKITSPSPSQNVSTGNLTIMGTSSDTSTAECQVYADWNDKKPFQRVVAAGPEGNRDYSKWNYTYSSSYHEIINGTNELTSKISCFAGPTNFTKWYSINVTGIEGLGPQVSSLTSQRDVNNSDGYVNSGPAISRVTAAEITPPQFDPDDSGESQDETKDEDNENEDNDEKTENESELEDDGTNPAGSEYTNSEGPDDEASYDDTLTYEQADEDTELFITNEHENDNDEEEEQEQREEQEQEQGKDSVSWDDLVKSVEPLSNDVDIDSHESESIRADVDEESQSIESPEEAPNVDNSIEPPFVLPEIAIPTNPPPLVPNLDELIQNVDEDENECDIDDVGFPFCDGRQEEKVFSEDKAEDECDIDDAGFPFCDAS